MKKFLVAAIAVLTLSTAASANIQWGVVGFTGESAANGGGLFITDSQFNAHVVVNYQNVDEEDDTAIRVAGAYKLANLSNDKTSVLAGLSFTSEDEDTNSFDIFWGVEHAIKSDLKFLAELNLIGFGKVADKDALTLLNGGRIGLAWLVQ